MRPPRVRFTVRRMMVAVAVAAFLLAAGKGASGYLGPRNGGYHGYYRYLGSDWRWHEVRGSIIFVKDGLIFTD